MIKILHLDENHEILKNGISDLGFQNIFDFKSSKKEIEKKISEYHGVVIRSRITIDKDLINRAENLKFIARVGSGTENIDCDYAQNKGITILSAGEGNANAVGEHSLSLILSLFNNIIKSNNEIVNNIWLRENNRGIELDGKTVGIIGYGKTGKSFAKKLSGFNVETLCNVPAIVRNGEQWYRDLGKGDDAGTKLYGVSGQVNNPGLWELPIGTTIREIIYNHAGGMKDGYALKGLLPGGASTDFLVPEHLDLPMDYGSIQNAGSRMGTGTMILMDDSICPVAMSVNLQHFFAQESCGFCTPCREGLPWIEELLIDIEMGRGRPEDLDILSRNAEFIGAPGNTFCLHATGAMEPLNSALKYFREDFEAHIEHGKCPYQEGSK